MIKRLRVKNFKALREIEIELTPIHVLIGPNDSGKTSVLDVLAALCRSVDHGLAQAFLGSWKDKELVWNGHSDLPVEIDVDFDDDAITGYGISVQFGMRDRQAVIMKEFVIGVERLELGNQAGHIDLGNQSNSTFVKRHLDRPSKSHPNSDELKRVQELLSGVHYYRFDPSFLALPVAPDSKRRFRMEPNGFGLTLCLDEIWSFDRDRFVKLEERFKKVFPHIKSIKLIPEKAYRAPVDDPEQVTMLNKTDGKGLYFELKGSGQLVPASQASDGTLLVLAYLSILYLPKPPRLLLVEEPENGIHPKRLRDILEILRNLVHEQPHTQVVLTTHSPYGLDLFKPEEVTLCTKMETGEIKTTRLSDSLTVMQQLNVFTLGEIWTSEGDMKIAESGDQKERARE
ncbi:MAG: AAA family ATPase [Planctomycetes bacterium]|nr:AAA family ATPase [Planctomycetota bacterium]